MTSLNYVSTGLKGLDTILQGLRKGDNVVWQVDDIRDYRLFIEPFIRQAIADKKNLIYIRFANHPELIDPKEKIKTYQLDAASGFESFSKQVHEIVDREGEGAFYVFDCLSDLLSFWATDLMIGNFFLVTCPFLFKLNTIAYFAILRNHHSFKTIARIRETTQLLLDAYDLNGKIYLHPLKVWNRYSPTMYLPHQHEGAQFLPLLNSVDAAQLYAYMSDKGAESARRQMDFWDRLFDQAEGLLRKKAGTPEAETMLNRLCEIMLGKEPRMLKLVKEHLTLEDLINLKARMIGTGYIGGKALGMLLARAILRRDERYQWEEILEPHDSFFIGSDVFYTYIVENGWWDLWLKQKVEAGYSPLAAELKEKMLKGSFPEEIREQFQQMIGYFGQSPIIVRSSSLLEDSFGNAFAGKYESLFCVNQGSPDERYARFEDTVRRVFASTLSEDALAYRQQRGLIGQDEQMALLVMRVSGTQRQHYYFPYLAGVGVSYNTFVWHKDMDPKAGMLRLVFGLGTRAVNRVEGDYPRIVALDAPRLQPYAGLEDLSRFSQHEVDVLNIEANAIESVPLNKLIAEEPSIPLELIAQKDREAEAKMQKIGRPGPAWVLTFDKLLSQTDLPQKMQRLLNYLEEKYQYPVDTEFTVNYTREGREQINLLQCRPLQAKGQGPKAAIPKEAAPGRIFFKSAGNFMGGNVALDIEWLVLVETRAYADLLLSKKVSIARLIGKINKKLAAEKKKALLMGPGRWGTRDATLGVPVSFAEINNFSALAEVADPEAGFMPELSFGSHFFLDLVEAGIFYTALFTGEKDVVLNRDWLKPLKNQLADLFPDEAEYKDVVKIYKFNQPGIKIMSDITKQLVLCLKNK